MYFGILVPQPKKNKKYVNSQREHKFMLFPRRKDKEQKKKTRAQETTTTGWLSANRPITTWENTKGSRWGL